MVKVNGACKAKAGDPQGERDGKTGERIMKSLQLPEVTRRVFLNRTLQALGAAAAMPLVAACSRREPPPTEVTGAPAVQPPSLEFLNADEYITLDAASDTLIPQGGAFEMGAREAGLAKRIDSYLPAMDPGVSTGFRGALAFLEQQAPEMAGKAAPFSALSEEDRTAVLDAMLQAGGLPAGIFLALKYVCMGHFYTMDETWQYTGYDGPMLLESAK
jgi:hypothetical protein